MFSEIANTRSDAPFISCLIAAIILLLQPGLTQSTTALDAVALETLRLAAGKTQSDAVILIKDGKPVVEWYFDQPQRPIELMSVVKSVVSLGIGRLFTLNKIDSLDQPVHSIYPEWNQGQKKNITIRHLLNHTSGLQNISNAGAEIYPSPNAVLLALAAEVTDEPGSHFSYNNKAVNLLSGIIEKLSGQRMDMFFVREFFGPMGIENYKWYFDPSGTPHAMAGLELHAIDLAKFGELVLAKGAWSDQQLVEEWYIDEMLAQGQPHYPTCGLLWWRLANESGEIVAYYGDGFLGQTLMVIPEHDLVAVRQVQRDEAYDWDTDGFRDFKKLVLDLVY